jgi:hypothetical protein
LRKFEISGNLLIRREVTKDRKLIGNRLKGHGQGSHIHNFVQSSHAVGSRFSQRYNNLRI